MVPLELELVPEASMPVLTAKDDENENPVEAPLIEPIRNGVIDLGEIVYQEIAAGLDPYPRVADVTLDKTEAGPSDDEATNPFAKLKRLQPPKQD